MHQRKAIYTLFIFIQSLIYGIGNPATKVAYKSITPLWLLAARFTLAFLLFLLLFGRRILPCIKKVSWKTWLPSSLCCAGAYISCNLALNLTAATNVGFIMSLPVLFTPFLASVIFHRPYVFKKLPLQLLTWRSFFIWHRGSAGSAGRFLSGRCSCLWRICNERNGRHRRDCRTDRCHNGPEPGRRSAF